MGTEDTHRPEYLTIYESELRVSAGIAVLYGKIECSMNGFGLWTRGGRLLVLLVVAPGPNAIRTACYCEQDIEFFRRISEIIETRLGIQWDLEIHSHHELGIPSGPSEGSEIAQIKAKFKDFLGSAGSPHGLDAYTKQAMAIALSVATRCEPCLKMHLKNAKEKGFTQDEIDEAAWMGISFAGSPAMVFYEQKKEE